jgi:hypothetical protein
LVNNKCKNNKIKIVKKEIKARNKKSFLESHTRFEKIRVEIYNTMNKINNRIDMTKE